MFLTLLLHTILSYCHIKRILCLFINLLQRVMVMRYISVQLAFPIIIKKLQEHTLNHFGVIINDPVFQMICFYICNRTGKKGKGSDATEQAEISRDSLNGHVRTFTFLPCSVTIYLYYPSSPIFQICISLSLPLCTDEEAQNGKLPTLFTESCCYKIIT